LVSQNPYKIYYMEVREKQLSVLWLLGIVRYLILILTVPLPPFLSRSSLN